MPNRSSAKTEVSSGIVLIDNFLTPEKCDEILKELEFVPWHSSLTYQREADGNRRNRLTNDRVSESAHHEWFTGRLNVMIRQIENRLKTLFGADREDLEYWQATNYFHNGKFDYHLDAGYWNTHYAGDRILSFLLYLNTPVRGGQTHFRALDVEVEAKAGRLLVWENLFPNGDSNHRMIHSARPLLKGKRTTLVTWQRQKKFRIESSSKGVNHGNENPKHSARQRDR
jgi:prolyl 4-hydroxylase